MMACGPTWGKWKAARAANALNVARVADWPPGRKATTWDNIIAREVGGLRSNAQKHLMTHSPVGQTEWAPRI
jgi:hypothetical protein